MNHFRSRLAIIPQNPFLFSGTVRENLDPLNQYADLHIYKALERCKVHSLVYRLGGLGATLDESGSNLSAGQKQLFCLVRAVLHNAKVRSIYSFVQSIFRNVKLQILLCRLSVSTKLRLTLIRKQTDLFKRQ